MTFDDLDGNDQQLNGEYPNGVIDWGSNNWWHSEPWGAFATKNVTFNGPGIDSAALTLLQPRPLVQLDVYNGGSATTVTLSCTGQPDSVVALASGELSTIETGWSGSCASVTIESTNGWDTNFDNLVLGAASDIPGPDTDGDGCSDAAEQQTAPGSEVLGGHRDPTYFWDFFDTPDASNVRDGSIGAGDIARIVSRFGKQGDWAGDPLSPPTSAYHTAFDRTPALTWTGPPNGSIDGQDILLAVLQFGHTCTEA